MSNALVLLPLLLLLALASRQESVSRKYYGAYTAGLCALAAYVVWAFASEQYSLTWVARYTASGLPLYLRMVAVYAGQEGTLLLWLLALSVVTWRYPWGKVSKVLVAEQLLLVVALLLLNPLAKSGLTGGIGLNPLLHNPWMLIHPPVVFIAYALLAVPFAEALLSESRLGRRYLHLGWFFLGLGLTFGGFWAYTVLGWGGFWAWDPVEAASLVPWLLATIALHRYRHSEGRTFGLGAYVAVIWAATITRSGLLSASSVHAFVGSSSGTYLFLLLVIHLGALLYCCFGRRQSQPTPLVWQAIALYALWVAAGTALPVLSTLVLGESVNVGPGFYRSGAIPALVLTLWGLRHSLRRDGTAKGLAHFGVVLFLVGAIASAAYTTGKTMALESGEVQELGSLELTYTHLPASQITAVWDSSDQLSSPLTLRQAGLVKPLIWRQLWQDVYIAPLSVGDRGGETVSLSLRQPLEWSGERLELLGVLDGQRQEGHTVIAEILCSGKLVAPALMVNEQGIKGRKARLPAGGAVALVGVDLAATEVTLELYKPEEAESLLVAEVSVKPLMNFVRFGVVLTLLGGLIAFVEDSRKAD